MAKEALWRRPRGRWASKCLPFRAICLRYHWLAGARRRRAVEAASTGGALEALASPPLASPSCLPLWSGESSLFIYYYIGIGRSRRGAPALPMLALWLCLSFVLTPSLSFSLPGPRCLLFLPFFFPPPSDFLPSLFSPCPSPSLRICSFWALLFRVRALSSRLVVAAQRQLTRCSRA